MKFRSIAVEGPIGVGKTSFVERLARRFDAHKVLEDLNNPFLQRFYEDQGFFRVGEQYDEDGIPHIHMLRAAEE